MKLLRMTAAQTRRLCFIIAEKMRNDGFYPELIVSPLRGGAIIGRFLSDILGQPKMATIACEFYTGINETADKPRITQRLSIPVEGKVVLLADDVSDRGDTLQACYRHIKRRKPELLKTAVLFVKPWSKFIPDYYATKTDKWIVFLGEEYETIRKLHEKNDTETLREYFTEKEIREALKFRK
ncbi:MAG: phosphoribosyltransferase [Candidatus Bathyarchaeia archaeon]